QPLSWESWTFLCPGAALLADRTYPSGHSGYGAISGLTIARRAMQAPAPNGAIIAVEFLPDRMWPWYRCAARGREAVCQSLQCSQAPMFGHDSGPKSRNKRGPAA